MANEDKRIIEQPGTLTLYNDDWLLTDRATEGEDGGTRKIQASVLKAWINDGMATEEELETAVDDTITKLSALGSASGAIATFDDGNDLPMPKLEVAIEPLQSGSGDPSPDNVRPISGWSEVNVTVADDIDNPTVENVYTINLGGTYYSCTLDVASGLLTVNRVSVDLGTLNWTYASTQKVFYDNLPTNALNVTNKNGVCEVYKPTIQQTMDMSTWSRLSNEEFVFAQSLKSSGRCAVAIKDLNYTDTAEFKSSVNGMKIVYPLATPQTIQLTPTQVKSLRGVNHLRVNTGVVLDAEYIRDMTTIINSLIARIEALENA